ncbi:head-tail connector protein [Lutibaculum baratangense]|uniref:PhiE125 gp8 family phage protein n=1 Tax=Lutibaculum baratangense AMV1 TaxID=631454 RepID=V4RBK6_9HYPH|nr:head-tail connector protein [Lutibaculum baratangense]ESR22794.1 hypothetical protein N177_3931 [Lutibaculum baratangense AMV1]
MTLFLVNPPAAEPVSLAEAKAFLKVETDDEDVLIGTLIAAARLHVEAATRRVLMSQGWRLVLDGWPPRRRIEIPLSPVRSVDQIMVYDDAGDPTVLPETEWLADAVSFPARIYVREAMEPTAAFNGIEIDLTAGYGPDPADVPEGLRLAILQLVAQWHETREPVAFGAVSEVPEAVRALTAPYRALAL